MLHSRNSLLVSPVPVSASITTCWYQYHRSPDLQSARGLSYSNQKPGCRRRKAMSCRRIRIVDCTCANRGPGIRGQRNCGVLSLPFPSVGGTIISCIMRTYVMRKPFISTFPPTRQTRETREGYLTREVGDITEAQWLRGARALRKHRRQRREHSRNLVRVTCSRTD